MLNPFRRNKRTPERRNYTQLLTGAFESLADGGSCSTPLQTAAVEFAVGLYSRSLSCAEVQASDAIKQAITPEFLSTAVRSLLRSGEAFYLIEVNGGQIELHCATYGSVQGDYSPSSWRYQLSLTGPTTTTTNIYAADQVIHFKYSCSPAQPWVGIPPWKFAGVSGSALAAIDRVMDCRANAPFGTMIGLPTAPSDPGQTDQINPLEHYHANMRGANGRWALYEHTGKWEQAVGPSRREGWDFGLSFDQAEKARNILALDIISAFGVPPSLFVSNSDGTAQRESYRRFLHTSLAPVAKALESELSVKLDDDVHIDLSSLAAADIAGRARAYKALTGEELTKEDAMRLVGFDAQNGSDNTQ